MTALNRVLSKFKAVGKCLISHKKWGIGYVCVGREGGWGRGGGGGGEGGGGGYGKNKIKAPPPPPPSPPNPEEKKEKKTKNLLKLTNG